MANSAIRLDFNQAANIHLDLFAKIAFDAAFLLDDITEAVGLVFGQIADLLREIHIRLFSNTLRAHLSDAIDRG